MGKDNSFGSYMLINSVVQTVIGLQRRNQQDVAADISEQFQKEMQELKFQFQDEMEARKVAALRSKMEVSRKYRAEEKFESTKLKNLTGELKTYFDECLPLKKTAIPLLLQAANTYKDLGYGVNVPLNVILFHTRQKEINYDDIYDRLDEYENTIGNIIFRRWCNKDIARNSAILNLHAIMGNIPTLVISPFFQGGKIHFTCAMWEAQSLGKPLIKPLFSIDCDTNQLKDQKGMEAIKERLSLICLAISSCARDCYMLLAHGIQPTLPKLISDDKVIRSGLKSKDNRVVLDFIKQEYDNMYSQLSADENTARIFSNAEKELLINGTNNALSYLQKL